MPTSRRRFLQAAGGALAMTGLSQLALQQQATRYGRILAQATPRKLALLVGINNYSSGGRYTGLQGCLSDLALQQALLISRFRFQPDDICVLSDETADKPNRANIIRAFEEHLIAQAQPGDVVVFHFSGHGSRVLDPQPRYADDFNSAFVPADATFAAEGVNHIMGRSLFLLMQRLQTENVTVVLDSCYAGGGTRGNARIRSVWDGTLYRPAAEELEYQSYWLRRLQIDRDRFQQLRETGVAKGVVIAAAQANQEALDVGFDGFYAGAFTFLLTQYLWQQTDSVLGTVARITRDMKSLSGQVPLLEAAPAQGHEQRTAYFVNQTEQVSPAAAVITAIEGDRAQVWLGGIDYESLATFAPGASFRSGGDNGQEGAELVLVSRQGLRGVVALARSLPLGTPLQESARMIPPDLRLRIGIDQSLAHRAAELQQAIATLPRVEGVIAQAGDIPYAGEIHYILSQMTPAYRSRFTQSDRLPSQGSVGLFSQSLDEWIPGSFGAGDGSGQAIANRLVAKLQALLAARLVKAVLKANTALINLSAAIVSADGAEALAWVASAFSASGEAEGTELLPHQLRLDQDFRFRICNGEAADLYISILLFVYDGRILVLSPRPWKGEQQQVAESWLRPNETLFVPARSEPPFYAQERGWGEALVIASRVPFKGAIAQLQALADLQSQSERSESEAAGLTLNAIDTLLAEVSGSRTVASDETGDRPIPQVRTADIAAFSIPIEIV
ncbi:caspase family protein [Almyronema epifaneia]|uniref:Caspase domain-containing protein n=1 Tax=Almyronema epifaneia S1 TaxID=2991925 RepID=A0ABW6IFG6_9CYAN